MCDAIFFCISEYTITMFDGKTGNKRYLADYCEKRNVVFLPPTLRLGVGVILEAHCLTVCQLSGTCDNHIS